MNDQNYTIAKIIGEPKTYGDKTRIAFTTNETGEVIHSLFTKFPNAIKPGALLWGHLETQEKDGKTYSNFFFGKDNPNKKGGMSEADKSRMTALENKITSLTLRFDKLLLILVEKGIVEGPKKEDPNLTSAGTPVPDFTPKTMNEPVEDPATDPEWDPFEGM